MQKPTLLINNNYCDNLTLLERLESIQQAIKSHHNEQRGTKDSVPLAQNTLYNYLLTNKRRFEKEMTTHSLLKLYDMGVDPIYLITGIHTNPVDYKNSLNEQIIWWQNLNINTKQSIWKVLSHAIIDSIASIGLNPEEFYQFCEKLDEYSYVKTA